MKRLAQIAALAAAMSSAALGQWTSGSGGSIYYTGGNVGIGTTNPGAKLSLGPTFGNFIAVWENNGGNKYGIGMNGDGSGGNPWRTQLYANGAEYLSIASNGNVGIGTTTPAYQLDVHGPIGATDIYVSSNALPDYVFDADYRNAPLPEVAKYIADNHHLPGMPSADDAQKSGLSVGEMQNKLLQKVEELTLHMIAADERNSRLEQQNRDLQSQLAQLRAQIEKKIQPAAAPAGK